MHAEPDGTATNSNAWRDGDLVVIRRGSPLPPLCMLSSEPATQTVKCYFHWQSRRPTSGGLAGLLRHYVKDVQKVWLDIPLSDRLMRRRPIGWALFALTGALAIATLAGLVVSQVQIAQMPAGAEKQWWNDIGVPALAVGGFLLTGLSALASLQGHANAHTTPEAHPDRRNARLAGWRGSGVSGQAAGARSVFTPRGMVNTERPCDPALSGP
jgi:hypothetical protein